VRLLPLPGVFQPHSDSLILADCLRREILRPETSVLDLCTGSGLLAVLAASLGASRVVAVDVSPMAVLSARSNAALNGVRVQAVRGDLFSAVAGQRFDLIVCNPPYVPSAAASLPRRGASRAWEGGRDGRAFIDQICGRADEHLNVGGVLLLVHSSVCGEQETVAALSNRGLETSVVVRAAGPLGPLLRERARWLRAEGLLPAGDQEEVIVVRARRPSGAVASPSRALSGTGRAAGT
jgi:release factor glutamine methyltransferase